MMFVLALGIFAAVSHADEARLPASPAEINSGHRLLSPMMLSLDGRWLVYRALRGQVLVDLETGQSANIDKDWLVVQVTPDAAWAPRKTQLALRVQREGRSALSVWQAGASADKRRELLVMPRRLALSSPPAWSPDGRTVFFVIHQDLPWAKSSPQNDDPPTVSHNVRLQVTAPYPGDPPLQRHFEREYPQAHAESTRSLLMALDLASGQARLLARGNDIDDLLYVSPDGGRIALVQLKRSWPGKSVRSTGQIVGDVYLVDVPEDLATLPQVDLETLEDRKAGWSDHARRRLTPALTDVFLNSTRYFRLPVATGTNGNPLLVWSPDSRYLAYATVGRQSTGDVFVYDIANKRLRNLTENVTPLASAKSLGYAESHTHNYDSRKFGNIFQPLWLPDGSGLLALGRGDAWFVPLDGAPVRNLTQSLPFEIRRILPSIRPDVAAVDEAGRITLIAKDRTSRMDSVLQFDPRSGAVETVADTGVWTGTTVATDAQARRLFYAGQTPQSSTNLYQLKLQAGAKPERVTRFKLELAERQYPESRVLRWTTPSGALGYGLLYLPVGANPDNKAPLVLEGSPGESESVVDVRAKQGARFYGDALHSLLEEGMAVLYADIPMSDEGVFDNPMRQAVEGAIAALDAAMGAGVIDEKRVGIVGRGYGGFMVNAVITQTNRFKAAASAGALSDWFADYMGGGEAGPFYHEVGEGRFEKPLWEAPERYVDNSPIRYWDKVSTPLLIVHDEGDPFVSIRHAQESFKGLSYLQRTAIFARYQNMGSGVEAERRIRGWFREHLLGAEAITHIADQGSLNFEGSE